MITSHSGAAASCCVATYCAAVRLPIKAAVQVAIGDGAVLGRGCMIMDRDYHPVRPGGDQTAERVRPVVVGAEARLGDFSILLPGATIGDGAVIPPFSVVTRKAISSAANHSR